MATRRTVRGWIEQALRWWTADARARHDQEVVPRRHARVLRRAGLIECVDEDENCYELTRKGNAAVRTLPARRPASRKTGAR